MPEPIFEFTHKAGTPVIDPIGSLIDINGRHYVIDHRLNDWVEPLTSFDYKFLREETKEERKRRRAYSRRDIRFIMKERNINYTTALREWERLLMEPLSQE